MDTSTTAAYGPVMATMEMVRPIFPIMFMFRLCSIGLISIKNSFFGGPSNNRRTIDSSGTSRVFCTGAKHRMTVFDQYVTV